MPVEADSVWGPVTAANFNIARTCLVPSRWAWFIINWSERNPPELRKALESFQQAADEQPDFAPAFSGLADTYSLLGAAGFDVLPRAEAMESARAAASKALGQAT
jgi:hypothetical protein